MLEGQRPYAEVSEGASQTAQALEVKFEGSSSLFRELRNMPSPATQELIPSVSLVDGPVNIIGEATSGSDAGRKYVNTPGGRKYRTVGRPLQEEDQAGDLFRHGKPPIDRIDNCPPEQNLPNTGLIKPRWGIDEVPVPYRPDNKPEKPQPPQNKEKPGKLESPDRVTRPHHPRPLLPLEPSKPDTHKILKKTPEGVLAAES